MTPRAAQILSRVDARLRALKLTDRAASIKSGMSADGIRTIRRQVKSGYQTGVRTETIEKLACGLETTPQWLLFGKGD